MLNTPLRLPTGLVLKNRLVVAPMTTYSSHADGTIRDTELDYLRVRAEGGFGSVMTAACYVHKSGHAFDGQWACSSDDYLASMRAAADAIHAGGAAAILQIHHGGRQCPSRLCGRTPMSASAVPAERANAETPEAMTEPEIEEIVAAFAAAAERAQRAGYDGVEIHGANTYLLQQFVSPHSNRREDAWGKDRLRFPLAVTKAVLHAVGVGYAVGYRFSPEEAETPGIRIEHTEALTDALLEMPLSWLHLSLRQYRQGSSHDAYEGPTLSRLHARIAGRMPFISVGAVQTLADAEAALETGSELVAIGRAAITEPQWPRVAFGGGAPRLAVPRHSGAETLTLPEGLAAKIYGVPGWFDVEEDEPATTQP